MRPDLVAAVGPGQSQSDYTPPDPTPEASKAWACWTDGACEPNPGAGGWGYRLISPNGQVVERIGGEPLTTNNRMELTAILEALHALPDGCEVTVISDSRYAVNGLTIWRAGWRRRGWMRKTGPMPNRDLWFALEEQLNRLRVRFQWVRGHSGDEGNERADALANTGRHQALQMETGSACIAPPNSDFRLLCAEVRVYP